ncbi:MAG TPA: glycosyl hydrolase family 28-related protein [Candidatus Acidoferrum sp.]|nr:glycosyl hydrolase family 28-related protein [Candidatus Acidoferrum sp.]
MRTISTLVVCVCLCSVTTFGQGSQRQSVATSLQGIPIPGAAVWACQAGSTPNYSATPPCTLTNIYSDPSLNSQFLITQPVVADGLGNYTYYAPAGAYVEVITGSNTTGYNSKIVLACAPNSTAAGCSGAAGNPAGSDTQVQINNHGTFGSVAGFALDNSTSPTVLAVPFSESIKGPLPRVDVTAYGADPTGTTDSTVAITNAAAAACNAGSTLNFPPGTYILTQPQLPSTSPVIPIPCGHINIAGSGDHGTAQSGEPPQAKLAVTNVGSSPNSAPVFAFKYPTNTGGITIQDLQVSGYNQAVSFYATPTIELKNVCATAQSTGLTDNVPLKVTNVSGFEMTGGCLDSGGTSLPMALFTGEAALGSEATVSTYVHMEHVRGSGGNFQYIQRADASGATPGNFVFDDVTPLASETDFLTVTNATGDLGQTAMPQFGPVFVLNSSMPEATGSGAVINFNSSGSNLSGVHVYNSSGSPETVPLATVRMTAGSLTDCEVRGTVGAIVEDASGNPVGSCSIESQGGLDFIANGTVAPTSRLRSEITTGANPTPNLRFYLSPNSRASYGVDAGNGFLFNDGGSNGFNASLAQTTKGSVDVQFANLFAPTSVSGAATTGGALPAGTYYPFVGTTSNNCATVSAPSVAGAPVILSGSNNAIAVTWVAPLPGVSTITGYCVAIASSAENANAGLSYAGAYLPGVGTVSGTITSVAGGMQFPMGNVLTSLHRFTPSGINVTGGLNFYADSGSANAYVITTSPLANSIPVGSVFNFEAAHANTGVSTLNVDGLGAISIRKNGGTGTSAGANLAAGDIASGQIVTVMYDGTNFQVQSTLGNASSAGSSSPGGTDAEIQLNKSGAFGGEVGFGVDSSTSPTLLSVPWNHLHLGAANYDDFNTTALSANRMTTVPDANTVLPQALIAAARTVVTGLDGTAGVLSTAVQGQCTDIQNGTNYTIASTDFGCVVIGTNASTQDYSLPQAGSAGFGNGFYFVLLNDGAIGQGTIVLTPTSSAISVNGAVAAASLVLAPGFRAYVWSPDNADYDAYVTSFPQQYGEQAQVDYTGRTTAIGTTTLLTPASAGGYDFTASLSCDSSSTGTVSVTVGWTDPSNTAQTATSSTATCTTLGSSSYVQFRQAMNVKSGTAITFSTTISNSPTYTLRLKLEGAY